MATWIHFIGKSYYKTPSAFTTEAAQLGVSRRISRQQAQQMHFKDTVLVCMWDGKKEAAKVFGQFTVRRLFGEGIMEHLAEGEVELDDTHAGTVVHRGCGSFVLGGAAVLQDGLDIPDVLSRLPAGQDVSGLMIGGPFEACTPYWLKDLTHRQGFRLVNGPELAAAVDAGFTRAKCPVVRGQFYRWPEDPAELTPEEHAEVARLIVEVEQYHRRDEVA